MSDTTNSNTFKTGLAEETVTIDGQPYVIRELTAAGRDSYQDLLASKTRFDKDGKAAGFTSVAGMTSKLLGMTLYGPDDKLVPAAVVNNWPTTVTEKLFTISSRLSGLGAKAKEEAKNDSPEAAIS